MTTDRLKIYSINYLVDYIEQAKSQNSRINVLTAAGLIEGKVLVVSDESTGVFSDFIHGMLDYYEKNYDIDDPFMDDQKNTFITIQNATLINGSSRTRLKYLIVYLDDIIGIAIADKENQ